MKNIKIPSPGKAARGKGGSRPLDHPGCGTMPPRPDNKPTNATAPSAGKAHPSSGGGERKGFYPNAPNFPATPARRASDKW
jgi:hypothetical protein